MLLDSLFKKSPTVFVKLVILIFLNANLSVAAEVNSTKLTETTDFDVESLNTTHRDDKILKIPIPLFTIVRFTHEVCNITAWHKGICMTSSECTNAGGTKVTTCAAGFGVCCLMMFNQCAVGATTQQNNTYFRSPGSPGYAMPGTCSLKVQRMSPDICQLRLDINAFSIAQPDPVSGVCEQDQFTVSGAANPVPVICGDNPGQHLYLHRIPSSEWTLTFRFSNPSSRAPIVRTWDIRITQIPCNSIYDAGENCLQYFTGVTGTIQSFNFAFQDLSLPGVVARQLANQDYTICLRSEYSYCKVRYQACNDDKSVGWASSSFTLNLNVINGPQQQRLAIHEALCKSDYLMIPRGTADNGDFQDRFCGSALSTVNLNELLTSSFTQGGHVGPSVPITSSIKPFTLHFYTNGGESATDDPLGADKGNMGFCLDYVQLPCS